MMTQRTYGIVGRGKLARHLYHYFSLKGLSVLQWHRESLLSAQEALVSCDVIIVALKDDGIRHWVESHNDLTPRYWVHCSGALVIPGVQGIHPLYTFSEDLYDLTTYQAIPVITEDGQASFEEIFPDLSNPHYTLKQEHKTLYHALCVIMGNLPTLLWQHGLDIADHRLNLSPKVFEPFLEQTLANTINHPSSALTGPIERGDWQTIEHHLKVLPDGSLKQIYQHFLTLFSRFPCPH